MATVHELRDADTSIDAARNQAPSHPRAAAHDMNEVGR